MTTADPRALITDAIAALCFRAKVDPDDGSPAAAQAVRAVLQRDRAPGDNDSWDNWFRAATGLGDRELHVGTEHVLYLYHDASQHMCMLRVPLPPAVVAAIAVRSRGVATKEVA